MSWLLQFLFNPLCNITNISSHSVVSSRYCGVGNVLYCGIPGTILSYHIFIFSGPVSNYSKHHIYPWKSWRDQSKTDKDKMRLEEPGATHVENLHGVLWIFMILSSNSGFYDHGLLLQPHLERLQFCISRMISVVKITFKSFDTHSNLACLWTVQAKLKLSSSQ